MRQINVSKNKDICGMRVIQELFEVEEVLDKIILFIAFTYLFYNCLE